MIYLYAVLINNNQNEDKIFDLINMLSIERREKCKKYVKCADQYRCILGEVLLKYILWERFDIKWNNVFFQYNVHGKPLLVPYEDIHFNIAHSSEWVLCGVSDHPIGVDIEGGSSDTKKIAERFFSRGESQYIYSQSLCNQDDAFYKIWTLKESYIKCIGRGLSIPLDSFRFEFNNTITLYNEETIEKKYAFLSKKIDGNFHMSVCTLNDSCTLWKDDFICISVDELLRFYSDTKLL